MTTGDVKSYTLIFSEVGAKARPAICALYLFKTKFKDEIIVQFLNKFIQFGPTPSITGCMADCVNPNAADSLGSTLTNS